jgi:hypothetical protein
MDLGDGRAVKRVFGEGFYARDVVEGGDDREVMVRFGERDVLDDLDGSDRRHNAYEGRQELADAGDGYVPVDTRTELP